VTHHTLLEIDCRSEFWKGTCKQFIKAEMDSRQ